jgi:hypothetical protein
MLFRAPVLICQTGHARDTEEFHRVLCGLRGERTLENWELQSAFSQEPRDLARFHPARDGQGGVSAIVAKPQLGLSQRWISRGKREYGIKMAGEKLYCGETGFVLGGVSSRHIRASIFSLEYSWG